MLRNTPHFVCSNLTVKLGLILPPVSNIWSLCILVLNIKADCILQLFLFSPRYLKKKKEKNAIFCKSLLTEGNFVKKNQYSLGVWNANTNCVVLYWKCWKFVLFLNVQLYDIVMVEGPDPGKRSFHYLSLPLPARPNFER